MAKKSDTLKPSGRSNPAGRSVHVPNIGIGDKDRQAIADGLARLLADTYTL